jgi:hypothetical protein
MYVSNGICDGLRPKKNALAALRERETVADVWGVEINKVNKANKTYTHGYTVRWYEQPKRG